MKIELAGEETLACSQQVLWIALNNPDVLTRCIPGCSGMIETAPNSYNMTMELKVAAVGGAFEGAIALTDIVEPDRCRITISGEGTLGQGTGEASFRITPKGADDSILAFEGSAEVGGLVVGVGQRVLGSVAKQLVKRFFKALRLDLAAEAERRVA